MQRYTKTIMYGNKLEIYEYETKPLPRIKPIKKDTDRVADDDETKFEKRKDNAQRAGHNFMRLVEANLSDENKPLMLLLTYGENMTDIAVGYKDLRLFNQKMRYYFGKNFKYIEVPEFQKRGAVHFHILIWGLSHELFETERETRRIADIWGHGYIYLKETDGNERIASYLAKYMSKAFLDIRLKNQKAYVASRNVERPIVEKDSIVILTLMTYVPKEDKPIVDRTYDTKWCGKCRYRLFNITKGVTYPISI